MQEKMFKRLEEFILNKNLSIRQFEKMCGVSEGVIGKAIRQNTSFSSIVIQKIINTFNDINLNWLFYGEGEMFMSDVIDDKSEKREKEIAVMKKELENLQERLQKLSTSGE